MREDDPAARITAPTFIELRCNIVEYVRAQHSSIKRQLQSPSVPLEARTLRERCGRELSPGARATYRRVALPARHESPPRLTRQYPQKNLTRCLNQRGNKGETRLPLGTGRSFHSLPVR